MVLYNAPVVKERYKRVISHFNKPKNSVNGQRLDPIDPVLDKSDATARVLDNP